MKIEFCSKNMMEKYTDAEFIGINWLRVKHGLNGRMTLPGISVLTAMPRLR